MKGPAAGFTQDGLARLFGGEVKTSSSKASHKTAKIVGSVCGVVGLALLIGLIWLAFKFWQQMRTNHEQPHELDGTENLDKKEMEQKVSEA